MNEYYLHDQSGQELAIIDLTTGKAKQINIGKLGSVDIAWSDNTALYDKQYYFADHLGSVRLAKNIGGNVLSARNYSAYGETIKEGVTSVKNKRYRFYLP